MNNKYVAFLRGINLGKRTIKMDDLARAFSEMECKSVQTVIASGNVLFDSTRPPDVAKLEATLEKHFGFKIGVVIRSIAALQALVADEPFAAYAMDKEMKFYLTMGAEPVETALKDIDSVAGDFDLVQVTDCDYFTVAFRQPNGRFGAGLDKLEKCFRDQVITTRNWNTIARIIKKANS